MRITFDPAKRHKTFEDRGLAFEDAALVFAGVTLELEDTRENYGETRHVLRFVAGQDGCGGLHPAWRGSSCIQYEKSQ